MKLVLNGKSTECQELDSISSLLEQLSLRENEVLVEQNGTAIQRRNFASQKVYDGDALEIVRMVAGG